MLTCKHCNTDKPETEFYASSKSKCKECIKAAVRLNREQNIDRIREYEKQRASLPHRVQARKEYSQTEKGKVARQRANDSYRKRYPMKYAAHVVVNNHIKSGRLIPETTCSVCGSTDNIEGHHDDYTKPLELRWLCDKCHKAWHRVNTPIYE